MSIEDILTKITQGNLTIEEAKKQLASYENLGFAKIDHHRTLRRGLPEAVYAEGKTVEQITKIIQAMVEKESDVLVTRLSKEKADQVLVHFPDFIYNETAQLLHSKKKNDITSDHYIAVLTAGTSDLQVAEEAALTAEFYGVSVHRFYDVGVAGLNRLLNHIEEIRKASLSIVVAGMDGALPSVVGGLVAHPVIAVPTSVGYGASFHGLSALLAMLNSCSPGVSVVNIDNGFGAAYQATMIIKGMNRQEENNPFA